jgi:hypothetical protein
MKKVDWTGDELHMARSKSGFFGATLPPVSFSAFVPYFVDLSSGKVLTPTFLAPTAFHPSQ